MYLHYARLFIIFTLIVSVLFLLAVGFLQLTLPPVAWLFPELETTFFDLGVYGAYRYRSYVSFNLTSPSFTTPRWDDICDDGGYVLLTPKGPSVPHAGPTIVDTRGNLIWMSNRFNDSMNLKVQQFKDQNYLTMWAGTKTGGQGKGIYYMLDSAYNIAQSIRAVGQDVHADLHEFRLSQDGTALFTIYNTTTTDLSSIWRPHVGWAEDSVFQEVDAETNELLFEWRASEHTDASDTFMTNPFGGYMSGWPFDVYHINSIDKDRKGNYLISSRHFHSVTYIGPDGKTIWQLGGVKNEFEDLSDGRAISFRWQHDARWVQQLDENGIGIISLFDNKEGGPLHVDGPYSRGLLLRVDVPNKTAEMLHEYIAYSRTRAPSQGSMEILANGNVFIGWGHSAAYSEFTEDGSLLCEWHFGPSMWDFLGNAVSYRATRVKKEEWIGRPTAPPDAKEKGWKIYVSWNGATKVAAWGLEVTKSTDENGADIWEEIDVMPKDGFENHFKLPTMSGSKRYRVAALDENGQVMRYSEVVEVDWTRRFLQNSATVLMWVGFAIGAWLFWTRWLQRTKWRGSSWKTIYEYRRL
jgi:Arylsulfotransferase (ASST)